jgi:hypothetical protein
MSLLSKAKSGGRPFQNGRDSFWIGLRAVVETKEWQDTTKKKAPAIFKLAAAGVHSKAKLTALVRRVEKCSFKNWMTANNTQTKPEQRKRGRRTGGGRGR